MLIGAAALTAAGILSASAQVYSVNVVGYINTTLNAGVENLVANPLDNGTNDLNSLCSSALPTKSTVQMWTSTGFTNSTKSASGWVPDFTVPPGVGFFLKPFSGSTFTNTFVGNVIAAPGGGTYTTNLTTLLSLVGCPIPYSGDINNTNINLGTLPTKSTIQVWSSAGYVLETKASTGWAPDTNLYPAEGFFVKSFTNNTPWSETLQ